MVIESQNSLRYIETINIMYPWEISKQHTTVIPAATRWCFVQQWETDSPVCCRLHDWEEGGVLALPTASVCSLPPSVLLAAPQGHVAQHQTSSCRTQVTGHRTEHLHDRVSHRTEQNRTEQNRTEQNRTEQNRTEQNRTEQNRTEQNRTEQNRTEHITENQKR